MQARRLPAERGAWWLLEGFRLYRRNPPFLTALVLTYLLAVQSIIALLPGIGPLLLPVILPTLTLIVANGCRLLDEDKAPSRQTLLLGVLGNGSNMLRLGGLQLAGAMLLVVINAVFNEGADPFDIPGAAEPAANAPDTSAAPGTTDVSADEVADAAAEAAMLSALLKLLLIASPLIIAFWFAPFLAGWGRVGPFKAVFFSLVGSWRNWRAMSMYSFAALAVAAVIPGFVLIVIGQLAGMALSVAFVAMRMVLVFIIAPVLTASLYVSYRDIYQDDP